MFRNENSPGIDSGNNFFDRKETTRRAYLRDLLIESTLSPRMVFKFNITDIMLGWYGFEADKLLGKFLDDPRRRERGKLITVTSDGRVNIDPKAHVGTPHPGINLTDDPEAELIHMDASINFNFRVRVAVDPPAVALPREKRQNRFLATMIHTHMATGPSYGDLVNLFYNQFNPAGHPLAFVINENEKWLVFRGLNTPQFSKDKADALASEWRDMTDTYFDERFSKGSSVKDQLKLNIDAHNFLLQNLCHEYNLRAYACSATENTAKLIIWDGK